MVGGWFGRAMLQHFRLSYQRVLARERRLGDGIDPLMEKSMRISLSNHLIHAKGCGVCRRAHAPGHRRRL